MNFDRKVKFVTRTNGNGYWSEKAKTVRVNRVELAHISDNNDFGELRVYFNTQDWNVESDGLIYSDMGWKHSFLTCMEKTFGFSPDFLQYFVLLLKLKADCTTVKHVIGYIAFGCKFWF